MYSTYLGAWEILWLASTESLHNQRALQQMQGAKGFCCRNPLDLGLFLETMPWKRQYSGNNNKKLQRSEKYGYNLMKLNCNVVLRTKHLFRNSNAPSAAARSVCITLAPGFSYFLSVGSIFLISSSHPRLSNLQSVNNSVGHFCNTILKHTFFCLCYVLILMYLWNE